MSMWCRNFCHGWWGGWLGGWVAEEAENKAISVLNWVEVEVEAEPGNIWSQIYPQRYHGCIPLAGISQHGPKVRPSPTNAMVVPWAISSRYKIGTDLHPFGAIFGDFGPQFASFRQFSALICIFLAGFLAPISIKNAQENLYQFLHLLCCFVFVDISIIEAQSVGLTWCLMNTQKSHQCSIELDLTHFPLNEDIQVLSYARKEKKIKVYACQN